MYTSMSVTNHNKGNLNEDEPCDMNTNGICHLNHRTLEHVSCHIIALSKNNYHIVTRKAKKIIFVTD